MTLVKAERLDIVGIGAINIDFIAPRSHLEQVDPDFRDELRESFEHGTEASVSIKELKQAIDQLKSVGLETFLGGSALLTIRALASMRLGLKLGYVGVCGSVSRHLEELGDWWTNDGIDRRWVLELEEEEPGLCLSYILDSERTLRTTPCGNLKMASHLEVNFEAIVDYVSNARIVHVSSFLDEETPKVLYQLLSAAKSRNPRLKLSLDPGHCWIPPSENVANIMKLVDILFVNDREFMALSEPGRVPLPVTSLQRSAQRIMARCNPDTTIVHLRSYAETLIYFKLGSQLFERRYSCPTVAPDHIEDATGAGDVFSAGFLAAQCASGFTTADGAELGLKMVHAKLQAVGSSSFINLSSVCSAALHDIVSKSRQEVLRPCIFLAHGNDPVWKKVHEHLLARVDHTTKIEVFENHDFPGENAPQTVRDILNRSTFAVILMTAEDTTKAETIRARQNVIHEAGLFEGRLGMANIAILADEKIELPSNLHGILHIRFAGHNVECTFEKLDDKLRKAHLL